MAYVVASGPPVVASDLKADLAQRLPEYMVPGKFVTLDALPLTGNGKVDRDSLPEPATARPDIGVPFVAPGTAVETIVAGVFGDMLAIDGVGALDDFFILGGDSITATLAISAIRDVLDAELALEAFFTDPTVRGVAAALDRTDGACLGPDPVAELARELGDLDDAALDEVLAEAGFDPGP